MLTMSFRDGLSSSFAKHLHRTHSCTLLSAVTNISSWMFCNNHTGQALLSAAPFYDEKMGAQKSREFAQGHTAGKRLPELEPRSLAPGSAPEQHTLLPFQNTYTFHNKTKKEEKIKTYFLSHSFTDCLL